MEGGTTIVSFTSLPPASPGILTGISYLLSLIPSLLSLVYIPYAMGILNPNEDLLEFQVGNYSVLDNAP